MRRIGLVVAMILSSFIGSANIGHAAQLISAYVIHTGDLLNVQVFGGDPALTQSVTVLQDGTIDYSLLGRVMVAGKSPQAAAAQISKGLERYVRHPRVTVVIAAEGQPNVLVLGAVKTPGKYALRSGGKVTDAIAAAGGLSDAINGSLPIARISDASGSVQSVNLESLLHDGQTNLDSSLGEGSVVYVPSPLTFNVEVAGAVDRPGDVRLSEGDRLSMVIAKAGDTAASNADLNHIRVSRTHPDGTKSLYEINLYRALEGGESQYDMVMQKNDVVYVPQARKGGTGVLPSLLGLLRNILIFHI